jgi:hypothetical protein
MRAPAVPGVGYTSTQPAGGSYKASSIKEGFICAGIWAILSAAFASGIQLWGYYTYSLKSNTSLDEWAQLMGAIVGQFVLMTICLSSVAVYRRWKNVTSFILLDWCWWLGRKGSL